MKLYTVVVYHLPLPRMFTKENNTGPKNIMGDN